MRNWITIVEDGMAITRQTRDDNQTGLTSHSTILENPKFKQWFAGSKVVDPKGLPLVCFHGSFEEFTEFKYASEKRVARGFNRLGFWFDVHPATANYFAGYMGADRQNKTGSVMPVFLNIKQPLVIDSEYLFDWDRDDFIKARRECEDATKRAEAAVGRVQRDIADGERHEAYRKYEKIKAALNANRTDSFNRVMNMLPNGVKSTTEEVAQFQASLIAQGYDGIHLQGTVADWSTRDHQATDWWIAFDSSQIKSIWNSEFGASPHIHEADKT